MRTGTKITVHLYDTAGREVRTDNDGEIFTVYEKDGQSGIDWNKRVKEASNLDSAFTPFEAFSGSVVFEDTHTGIRYHMENGRMAKIY